MAAPALRPSVLDKPTQPAESIVPLLRNSIKIVADIDKPSLIQLPDALATMVSAAHETRFLHHLQVLGNSLTRHLEAIGQPSDGRWAIVTESGNQSQTSLVPQRRKHRRRVEQLRERFWTTLLWQGIFRSASRPYPSPARSPGMPWHAAPMGFDRSRIQLRSASRCSQLPRV